MFNIKIQMISVTLLLGITITLAQPVELTDKKTFNSNSYRNPDNSITTEIFISPVNYLDPSGNYKAINPYIVSSNTEYDFEVTEGFYSVYLKANLQDDYPLVFEMNDGANLRMKIFALAYLDIVSKEYHIIKNIKASTPKIENNSILYKNAFAGIDIKFTYKAAHFKEEILISQSARDRLPDPSTFGLNYNDTYIVFLTRLDLTKMPMIYANENKLNSEVYEGTDRIDFRTMKGRVRCFMPVDWAYLDANIIDITEKDMKMIRRRLIKTDSGHILLSGIKASDLNNMSRGTIIFDPQIIVEQPGIVGYDNFLYEKKYYSERSYWNYGASARVNIIRSHYASIDKMRPMLLFDLSSIPDNSYVNDAKLELFCDYLHSYTVFPTDINIHKITSFWEEGNKIGTTGESSWIFRTETEEWASPGGDYESTIRSSFQISDGSFLNTWFEWDVKSLITEWLATPETNYGMLLRLDQEDISEYRYLAFKSSDNSDIEHRPKLTVTYSGPAETVFYIRDASGNVIATYQY